MVSLGQRKRKKITPATMAEKITPPQILILYFGQLTEAGIVKRYDLLFYQ